jgi:hypothetical protein
MKKTYVVFTILALIAASAQAEIRVIDVKIFGMD